MRGLVLSLLGGFLLGSTVLLCTVGSARKALEVGEVAADLGALDAQSYLEGVEERLSNLEAEKGEDGSLGVLDWIYILTAIGGSNAAVMARRNYTRRKALNGQDHVETG